MLERGLDLRPRQLPLSRVLAPCHPQLSEEVYSVSALSEVEMCATGRGAWGTLVWVEGQGTCEYKSLNSS